MSYKKYFLIVFVLLISFNFSFAQDGEFEDGPSTPTQTNSDEEINIYLNNTTQKTAPQTKTKAQIFNGKKSGVYEGQVLTCPYAFERELTIGMKGEDVRLLQIILNSDKRHMVALDGPGSLGQETSIFGEATKRSLAKLQALYYPEYIPVVNGRFNYNTRVIVNAMCNGQTKPKAGEERDINSNIPSVQKDASPTGIVSSGPTDKISPRISIAANINAINPGDTFKVILTASEEIKPITPESVIVDGGSVKEIRKLSKVSYTIIIVPDENVKQVVVQIEADKISDLADNVNDSASNEVAVKVNTNVLGTTATTTATSTDIDALLNKIIASAPQCTYGPTGLLLRSDSTGKTLNVEGCPQQQQQGNKTCPNGQQVPAGQNCPEQVVCNTSTNYFTGQTQQQCQTASQAAQQQQNSQMGQLGKLLGDLLGKGGLGGGGLGGGGNSGGGGGGGGGGTQAPGSGAKTELEKATEARQTCASAQDCKEAQAKLDSLNDKTTTSLEQPKSGSVEKEIKTDICLEKKDLSTNQIIPTDSPASPLYLMSEVENPGKLHSLLIYNDSNGTGSTLKNYDCAIYKPNSLKKVSDNYECCSKKYDPKTKKCTGTVTKMNSRLYKNTAAQQLFGKNACVDINQQIKDNGGKLPELNYPTSAPQLDVTKTEYNSYVQ